MFSLLPVKLLAHSHVLIDSLAPHLSLSMIFLIAGKVHGSLARAGKVRGQTPKVQKQDKKKQPKGRAMKRIKYNRRFVNVGELIRQYLLSYTTRLRRAD